MNSTLSSRGRTWRRPRTRCCVAAYDAMVASLQADRGTAFDRDYVDGQIDYQKGNAALFQYEIQNGFDADLKKFARQTLPKIEDHLHRALALTKQHR
jgi:putative membrane protein